MKNPFKRQNKRHVLQLTRRDAVPETCVGHVLMTMDYGAHPKRQMVFCPRCSPAWFALLDWKDPYARTANRIFFGIPFIFTAFLTIGTIIAIVILYLPHF